MVLDASVILKWILPETDSYKADRLKYEHKNEENTIHIPSILYFELTNTLSHTKALPFNEINKFISDLKELELFEEHFALEDHVNIISLSRKFLLSGYDASYVYLAQKLNTSLITADIKLFKKTKNLGFVKLL